MTALQSARQRHEYRGEIHYREIGQRSQHNPKFLVAQDWVRDYFAHWLRWCPFKAFIADYTAREFPYPGDAGYEEHLLRSVRATLTGGLAWSYHGERLIRLRVVHDETDAELDRAVARDLTSALTLHWNTKRGRAKRRRPWLVVSDPEFVTSDPTSVRTEQWPDSEFVQLCDLLLGACVDAVRLKGLPKRSSGRLSLSRSVLGVLGDTLKVPWLQTVPVHRKFSVSLYPDQYGFAYPAAVRLARRRDAVTNPTLPGFDALTSKSA